MRSKEGEALRFRTSERAFVEREEEADLLEKRSNGFTEAMTDDLDSRAIR